VRESSVGLEDYNSGASEQVAQRDGGSPALGDFQCQVELGYEQPDLAVDVLVCCRGLD